MPIDAKTIQIFLPDGEPRGIRIAEITTSIMQAVQVPRARLDRIMSRKEIEHIGVYFLFGESGERAKPVAYIGHTEGLKDRIKEHHAKKDFWTTAVFLISKTDSFTLAHIRYLEWYAIKQAKEAGRYILENSNDGSKPYITEPMEADVLDAFKTGSVLLSTLGYPIFEPVAGRGRTKIERMTYVCTGPNAKGSGRMVEDGFVVLKGSTARAKSVSSAHKYISTKRQAMLDSGVLVPDGELSLRFTEDYLFDSPSGAAKLILGRNANGWTEWKTEDERTLDEVERQEIVEEDKADNA
ncbi:MAG TPA: GIY-YIG nuclease family protein [Phycisphaerae bacterium]|nr:GIY-YIG nuclease family protein [Phycisphaerae bacterium]